MIETKGIVMRVTDQHMVVMCDDGKFRNLPLPKEIPGVGEYVVVPLQRKKRISFWVSVAAAFFIFLLGSILWNHLQAKTYYVVAIDINPSFELYLDSAAQIIRTEPLNQDAVHLLHDLQLKKLTLNEAIPQLIKKSIDLGYISKEKKNLIMVSIIKVQDKASEISPRSVESLIAKTFQSKSINGYLKVDVTNESEYKESKQEGLSLNKWLLIHEAKKKGYRLSFEKFESHSVESILDKAGTSVEKFFSPIGIIPPQPALPLPQTESQSKQIRPEQSNGETDYYQRSKQEGKVTDETPPSDQKKETENDGFQSKYNNQLPTDKSNEDTYPSNPSGTTSETTSGSPESSEESSWSEPMKQSSQDPTNSTSTQNEETTTTQSSPTSESTTNNSQTTEPNSDWNGSSSGAGGW
ncbi:anti-sigma factor domain-containing protein [Tepidibacillus infernus]|uniref:anti-sigma factor domain-containing protein n=1 Tax=Tepidibacillus infernus TaxID=1806172 RepID=UPI003B71755E